MLIKINKIPRLLLLMSVLMLCQCASVEQPTEQKPPPVKKKLTNPYALPTASYLAMAKEQEGDQKQANMVLAAGRLISEGQWQQARLILSQISNLNLSQLYEKKLLLAKIELMRDRPKAAQTELMEVSEPDSLPLYQRVQYHELLAQSYKLQGSRAQAVFERIKLESLLPDTNSQISNGRALWFTLANLSPEDLHTLSDKAEQVPELRGWLQLLSIAQQHHNNPQDLLAALKQWQSQFSHHPANQLLPNPLESISDKIFIQPRQVALLLPLSGPLAGPGNAIREGFMASLKDRQGETALKVKTYDTDKADIAQVYQKALAEGAEYVVGPLIKDQVAVVASLTHPVPTLLLNDSATDAMANTYSFGLSPTHEATQVAIKARNKGYSRALIIAPKNNWGDDITKAFTKQWQKHQGRVVDTLLYAPQDDLTKKMQDFLHITQSQAREKQLKQIIGEKIESSISHRQDFDMIFLLAYPSKARQIMPLLKYYDAGNVPVFATSSVYGGSANALKDKDLDGLIFCDIPWVFAHQMGSRNWPEQFNSYNRLYALGTDSYALATQLNQLLLFPADGSMEDRGTLYLKSSGQVARVLEWGQFKQGLVHSLNEPARV